MTSTPRRPSLQEQLTGRLSDLTSSFSQSGLEGKEAVTGGERTALVGLQQRYADGSYTAPTRTWLQNTVGNDALKRINKDIREGKIAFQDGAYRYTSDGREFNFNTPLTGINQETLLEFRGNKDAELRKGTDLGIEAQTLGVDIDTYSTPQQVLEQIRPKLRDKIGRQLAADAGLKEAEVGGLSGTEAIKKATILQAKEGADLRRLDPDFIESQKTNEQSRKESEANILNANERTKIQRDNLTAQVASNNADRALRAQEFNQNYALQLKQAQSQAEYNTAQLQAQIEQSRLLNEQANLDRERLNAADEREYRFRLKELEQRRFDDIFNAIGNLNLY